PPVGAFAQDAVGALTGVQGLNDERIVGHTEFAFGVIHIRARNEVPGVSGLIAGGKTARCKEEKEQDLFHDVLCFGVEFFVLRAFCLISAARAAMPFCMLPCRWAYSSTRIFSLSSVV